MLMVHGIGSDVGTQKKNEAELFGGVNKVIKGGYFDSKYRIVSSRIDWKTMIESSDIMKRMQAIHTPSHV